MHNSARKDHAQPLTQHRALTHTELYEPVAEEAGVVLDVEAEGGVRRDEGRVEDPAGESEADDAGADGGSVEHPASLAKPRPVTSLP